MIHGIPIILIDNLYHDYALKPVFEPKHDDLSLEHDGPQQNPLPSKKLTYTHHGIVDKAPATN